MPLKSKILTIFLLLLASVVVPAVASGVVTASTDSASLGGSMTDTVQSDSLTPDTIAAMELQPAKKKKTGSWIKRFIRSFDDYDTAYIEPNYYNYTAMLQNTNFYQLYFLEGTTTDDKTQQLRMSPSPSFKVGPYFGWRWLFLGYTVDALNPTKAAKSTEFSLSLYSSMIGADFVYINSTGDFTIRGSKGFSDAVARSVKGAEFSGMDAYTLSLSVYYVFNHRHFSYPAAFSQSTVQRKSCGSWMLGLSYTQQRISFDYTQLPEVLQEPLCDALKISKVDYKSYNVSFGYAYNWVFARNWLFSISLMPALGFKQTRGERIDSKSIWNNVRDLKFDFTGRTGLVWNNSRIFAGLSLVNHLYDYQQNSYAIRNLVNYFNIYVGFMFNRKRQYR